MKLKIFKHTSVKANIEDDIVKAFQYFKSDFVKQFIPQGIDFTIDIEQTTIPKQDATIKLMIPQKGKYDFVMCIYERDNLESNVVGDTQTISNNLQGIILKVDTQLDATDFIWKAIVHEILHAITYKLLIDNKIVFNYLYNCLDLPLVNGKYVWYYGNNNPYLVGGNYYQQLNKIAPFFTIPTVILTRGYDDGIQTLGNLSYKNFTCQTLEKPSKNNQKNISCIPKGTYLCKWTFSPKFLKYTYEVQKVPARSGIRIHSGNYFFDIEGCILLGDSYKDINKDGKTDVLNSKITIKKFEQFLNKKDFTLIIQ